jgi:predicted Zn-dependent protease
MWLFRKKKKIEKDTIIGELWENNFDRSDKNRFELEETEFFNAKLEDKSLKLTTNKRNVFVWSLNNVYRYKDFILDSSISICEKNDHSAAGILFRYADEFNYYYLMVSSKGLFRLDVVFNGSPRILIPWTSCNPESFSEINIRIIVHGTSIFLFLDNIWIGEIEDDSIDAGYIAFGGQNFSNKDTAVFSLLDIRIESRAVEVELGYQSQVRNGTVSIENRMNLAERLFDAGQYSAVLIQIKKALKNSQGDYKLTLLLARSFSYLNFYDEALTAFDRCIMLSGEISKEIITEKASLLYRINRLMDLKEFLLSNKGVVQIDSFLLNMMGNTEDGLGNFKDAVDYYKVACELDKNSGDYRLNAARTLEKNGETEAAFDYYHNAALCFFRDESFGELPQLILNMNRIKPGNTESKIIKGKIYFQEGRLNEAFQIFENLKNNRIQDSSVDFLYGIILRERGEEEKALALFESSANSEENFYPYWFKFAESLYLMGLPAEDKALKAMTLEPENPWIHNLYGLILLSEDRNEESKTSFARALELEGNSVDILINYSNAVAVIDGIEAALTLFSEESDNPSVQNQLGNLLYSNADYEKAAVSYGKAVNGDGSSRTYKENLASALIKQDRILAAEEILSGLMEEYLSSATLEMTAQVAFRKGQYNRANASFIEAIKLEPANTRILLNYGDFLYTRLDYQGVLDVAEKVLSPGTEKRVKHKETDAANSLLSKVFKALNDRYNCSACGLEWNVPKNIPVIGVVRLHGEPVGESPAGKCRICQKIYCVNCAIDYIQDNRFVCPDCNEPLKLSENYLKYLAKEYVKK